MRLDPGTFRSAAFNVLSRGADKPKLQVVADETAGPDLLSQLSNDHGNSERLIALYGNDLYYCPAFRDWLVWDGCRYAPNDTNQARRLAKQTMLETLRQAVQAGNESVEKFARSSLDSKRIASMLTSAECEIFVRPEQLDSDPFLLAFLNGTVELRTGTLRPHSRADLITKLVPHQYRKDAKCPRWLMFLEEVLGGGPDASSGAQERAADFITYLQRAIGYSLTGSTIEKVVFVPFGSGNNGKTVLLSTILRLLPDHSCLLQVSTLMCRQESNNSQADLADLRGARFVQTSETEEGQRLAQGKLKRITQGMGTIKAVRKYENPVEFRETHKLWLDTNRKPTIADADDQATFNRLHPIPFTVTIPSERIDKRLPEKLLAEAEGILAWAVEGARLWYESGLVPPREILAAKEEWRAEMDQIGRFLAECCVVGDACRARAGAIYDEYKRWSERSGEHPMTAAAFGRKLPSRGFSKQSSKRGVEYHGVGLRLGQVEEEG